MTTVDGDVTVDHELVSRLRLAVGRLARRLRQQAGGEVTPSQHSALSSVGRLGPVTLGELAAVERVRPPTMTRIVASLEEAGLVERHAHPGDRRVAQVQLSAAGRDFLQRSGTRKDAFLAERLARLAPEEVAQLAQAVAVIERLLEDGR
ncbi:MAG TPA: MarR family transcriptional regulator [Actinomycetota bacterium]